MRLPRDPEDLETHSRLLNWGDWVRGGKPRLTYPSGQQPKTYACDVRDAEIVENRMIDLPHVSERAERWGYVIMLHYVHRFKFAEWRRREFNKKFNEQITDRQLSRLLNQARASMEVWLP